MRRVLYLVFLVLAWVRTISADRLRWRDCLREFWRRLGWFSERADQSIWIHGEGMGEFNAAGRLVEVLRQACPRHRFVFSASRPATCRGLAAKYPHDICLPPPWDLAPCVLRFFQRLRPHLLVLIEFHDGFCPGALLQARREETPVVVVNGRTLHALKPLRYRVAERLGLVAALSPYIDRYCVQDESCGHDLEGFGVPAARIQITGNMKYDQANAGGDLDLGIPSDAPVLVAGCIHADEEELVLDCFERLRAENSRLFLILAPHDPGRADSLSAALQARGMAFVRRSRPAPAPSAAVLLLDSLGELAQAYRLATVVLLGGSFTPSSAGHSLAEAAAAGKPIVCGAYMGSQREMLAAFVRHEAVWQRRAGDLVPAVRQLLNSVELCQDLGRRGREVVATHAGATDRTLAGLWPLLPRRPDPLPRPAWPLLKVTVKSLAMTRPGQMLLTARSRRVPSVEALRDRLGRPATILCLGNGPSSEDPRLRGLPHDCLMRVNWRWLERGFLARPDVVFTGDLRAARLCPPCIFGFRTIAEETSILLNTFLDPRRKRLDYFTMERWPSFLNGHAWGARPTNGMVMIAAAVALRPQRLILAGIDLFQHPAGRYPGAAGEANQYAVMHDRHVELAIIRQALSQYQGELIVLSDVLAHALAA